MQTPLDVIAPAFVAMAHGIGVAVVATSDRRGRPRTRVMQPVWQWEGTALAGWACTSTEDPKVADLAHRPIISLTYWEPGHDTCTADCDVEMIDDDSARAAAWRRFDEAPRPAGFDPAVHPEWESPSSPTFGVLRLHPHRLRVMPGTLMTRGEGEVRTWRA